MRNLLGVLVLIMLALPGLAQESNGRYVGVRLGPLMGIDNGKFGLMGYKLSAPFLFDLTPRFSVGFSPFYVKSTFDNAPAHLNSDGLLLRKTVYHTLGVEGEMRYDLFKSESTPYLHAYGGIGSTLRREKFDDLPSTWTSYLTGTFGAGIGYKAQVSDRTYLDFNAGMLFLWPKSSSVQNFDYVNLSVGIIRRIK